MYDPEIPLSWPHLHNATGRIKGEEDGLLLVAFDFKPQLGELPCEPVELVKEKS